MLGGLIKEPIHLVVEGAGDAVVRYYEPAFRALASDPSTQGRFRVTFVDRSEFWGGDPGLESRAAALKARCQTWGAEYLDKSDSGDENMYLELQPDYVFVVTPAFAHVEVIATWLKRQTYPVVFVEKPLADSLDRARDLVSLAGCANPNVLAFDHCRVRLLPSRFQMDAVLRHLDYRLMHFTYYGLEDHSGADPDERYRAVGRDGAIENEQRVESLRGGVLLDTMPHALALLGQFGEVNSLCVTRIHAGRYLGVDGDPQGSATIPGETFAGVQFNFTDYDRNLVSGAAYLGKGIRGVRRLPKYDRNVRVLELEGVNGNKVLFDLRSDGECAGGAQLLRPDGSLEMGFPLIQRPYHVFLQKVIEGTFEEDEMKIAMPLEVAKQILSVVEEVRYLVGEAGSLPSYESGLRNRRESPYLEDAMRTVGVLWGRR